MNRKTLIALVLSGLFAASLALAAPYPVEEAPQRRLDACIAEVSNNADYEGASGVTHLVESKPRSISGFTVRIKTEVYDGESIIREYRSNCAINRLDQIRYFRIRNRADD